MDTLINIVFFVWLVVISRITYKLSVESALNKSKVKELVSSVRGLKLVVKVLGARHQDPD